MPEHKYWIFECSFQGFFIGTPWFLIEYSHYNHRWNQLIYWLGFEFWWKRNKNLQPAEFYFLRVKTFMIDSYSREDMVNGQGRRNQICDFEEYWELPS